MSAMTLLAFLLPAFSALAQDGNRPNHGRRTRPHLETGGTAKWDGRPWLLTAPISHDIGLFLNSNMISEPNGSGAQPQNESSIAVNPVSPRHLISSAVDARPGAHVYVSSDAGRSWHNVNFGVVHPNWVSGNDPSVAWDWLGNAYVMYGGFAPFTVGQGGQSGIYIARSTDNGANWAAHIPVIEHLGVMTADSAFEDKYYIQIDNAAASPFRGYIYTPWKRVTDRDSATQIMTSRSTDRGATWSMPIAVSPRKPGTSLDTTFGQSFPIMATGPDGTLYVCWNDGPIRSIGFARSTDAGLTWTDPAYPVQGYATLGTARRVGSDVYHVLKETFRAETYPTLAVDNSPSTRSGWIYLVWSAGRNPDIYFQRSTDKGETWSTPVVVHSNLTGDQWWPWISVDQTNGDVAVMYSDSRDDPQNILIDQYVSYSSDGGTTWIDRRVTDTRSDFRLNPYANRIFAGDYSGNAFHNGMIYPSFLDTRDDNDVYTAVISVRQPAPVERLSVGSRIGSLETARVAWTIADTSRSLFGVTLDSMYTLVYRDGALVARLTASILTFDDVGLIKDTVYTYTVVVASGADTSIPRTVCYDRNALARPLGPTALSHQGYSPQFSIDLRLPTRRGDSVSPLENLSEVRLYRDGELVASRQAVTSDTGTVVSMTDAPGGRAFRRYWATVADDGTPAMESMASDTVEAYVGSLDPYVERFDSVDPTFRYEGAWGITSTIGVTGGALTDSPEGDYRPRRNDAVRIWPVRSLTGGIYLRFAHIAIVDPGDTAYVERSTDRGESWVILQTYSWNAFEPWRDKKADPGDWQSERLLLDDLSINDAPVDVRFRLKSGALTNADGWYIDNIEFGEEKLLDVPGEGSGSRTVSMSIEPSPARSVTTANVTLSAARPCWIRIYDMLGRVVTDLDVFDLQVGRNAIMLDLSRLPAGRYVVTATSAGIQARQSLIVLR